MKRSEVMHRYLVSNHLPVETALEQKDADVRMLHVTSALRESQRRLFTLIDSLPGTIFSCANDPEWSMTYLSDGVLTLTGYRREDLIGDRVLSYDSITHPEDLPKVLETIETSVACGKPYTVEYRIRTKSTQEKWVWEKGAAVCDPSGKVLGLEGVITDITGRKQAEEAMRQAEAKYRSIFENAIEGIFQTTPDGHYISANPALARIYGYSSPDELMERLTDIEHQLYVEQGRRAEFISLLQEHDVVSEFESQVYRKDSSIIWISENARAVRDLNGMLLYYEGSVEDITPAKQAKEQLLHHAFYDILTGLPNRALFMERLQQAIARSKQCQDYLFAVLFLDLDRFKEVNDSLGHLVGDRLLVAIARRLEACMRPTDTLARLGGDEFTIILENIEDINSATRLAERIHKRLTSCFNLDGHEVFTSASIGIVLNKSQEGTGKQERIQSLIPSMPSYDRPEDLLRDADAALYRAKTLGKARLIVFDKTMHHNAVPLLQLENDLHYALERQEFHIHYQPIVSLCTGKISGFEALLRWQHPTKGLIAPSEFIPLAEENGLIVPMGWWILSHSCRQLKSWQQAFPNRTLRLTVNLSSRQLFQPDLLLQINQVLQETGFDGRNLMVDITESCFEQDAEGAIAILTELRNQQIQVCIDDFGTGYSSLSFLHQLPVNALKIDRSFVKGIDLEESRSLHVLRTIVMLAHNLGMEAIAEGVETASQEVQLRLLKCQSAQGYFFYHPMDAQAAVKQVKTYGN